MTAPQARSAPSPRLRGEMLWGRRRGYGTIVVAKQPMERPMKRNDLSRSLVAFDQNSTLVAVVELSLKTWLVAGLVPGLVAAPKHQPRRRNRLSYSAERRR